MRFVEQCKRMTAARLDAFLGRAADPEAAFHRLERELKDSVRSTQQAEAKARASVRSAQEALDRAAGRLARLEKGTVLALEQGDEALAREILAEQVKTEKTAQIGRERLEGATKALDDVLACRSLLRSRLDEMISRKAEWLARARAVRAGTDRVRGKSAVPEAAGSILEQVARMEGQLDADEAELSITALRAGQGGSIEDRLRRLEHEAEIERRLNQMRKDGSAGGQGRDGCFP